MANSTETKVYLKIEGPNWYTVLRPYENFAWTGKFRIKTIDNETMIYLERYVKFFGIWPIPFWTVWEEEDDIVFREESCVEVDCHV